MQRLFTIGNLMLLITAIDITYLEIKYITNNWFYIFSYKILCLIPRLFYVIPTE